MFDDWKDLIMLHWGKIIGGLAGLILAILIIAIGFWRSLFVILCIAVGAYVGLYLERNGSMKGILEKIWPTRNY